MCHVTNVSVFQISRLCAEEAAAQEQTGQVEECLKVNLLKLKQDGCKKVKWTLFPPLLSHAAEISSPHRFSKTKENCRPVISVSGPATSATKHLLIPQRVLDVIFQI